MRIVCKVLLFHVSILYMFRLQKTVVAGRTEVPTGLFRSTDQAANFCTAVQGPEAYAFTQVQNTATDKDQSVDDASSRTPQRGDTLSRFLQCTVVTDTSKNTHLHILLSLNFGTLAYLDIILKKLLSYYNILHVSPFHDVKDALNLVFKN